MTACTRSAVAMLTDFFSSDDIEATARRTGFVKRTAKITGKIFLALVTFGVWNDADTTLAQLAAKVTQLDEQRAVSPEDLSTDEQARPGLSARPDLPSACQSPSSRTSV